MFVPPSFSKWFWRGAGRAPFKPARDPRVDVFRGLALIVIFIDHVAGNWLTRATPSAMGLSDAAEYFVLLAGYSAALAYGSAMDRKGLAAGSAQVVARMWRLYTAHLGLFLFMAVTVAVMVMQSGNPLYYEHVAIRPFFQDPANAVLSMAALLFLPNYLDILPLYIILLALLPALWVLARMAPALAVTASVGLYAAAAVFDLAIPNVQTGGVWFFNPFAWQLLFTVGVVAGQATLQGVSLPRGRTLMALAAAMVVLGLVNAAPWTVIPGLDRMALPDLWRIDADKTNLSFWRFGHALALAYIVARLVPRDAAFFSGTVGARLGEAGRHSLPLFCLGVILSLCGTFVFFEIGRDLAMQVAVNGIGVGLLLLAARVLEWYRKLNANAPPAVASSSSEVRAA